MTGTPFYITTTLPYVNAEPHIGFALEIVQADALARFRRRAGDRVFFNTGTDEHGQKIYEAAEKAGEEVQAYVDRNAASVDGLKTLLDLSYDAFTRTTSAQHERAAQELWRRCADSGDIYKQHYSGRYCVGCEVYLSERDLDAHGQCPLHPGKAPVVLEEENYFFALSNYQQQLEEYLSREGVIVPEHRRQEALAFVKNGLADFSISRSKERLPWGVPVPGDDEQVMYVWFDALSNYISTLGWPDDPGGNFHTFWEQGETLQMAGKDQVRFQSIMWQAMLCSAGIKTADRVFYHGFINSGGQRMSKSLGNVIRPPELVERYGTDAARYILLRHVHPTDDTDITWEKMDEWYTAHLVNGLGNLVARVMNMAAQHLNTPVDISGVAEEIPAMRQKTEAYEFNAALDAVWHYISENDELIEEQQPYKVVKEDPEQARKQLAYLVGQLWMIAAALEPFMPQTSETIKQSVRENKKPANLFPRLS